MNCFFLLFRGSVHTLQEVYIDLFDQLDESLLKALQNRLRSVGPGHSDHSVSE